MLSLLTPASGLGLGSAHRVATAVQVRVPNVAGRRLFRAGDRVGRRRYITRYNAGRHPSVGCLLARAG